MTKEEATTRRSLLFKRAKVLHLRGAFRVGQVTDILSDEYDIAYDTSYNTKAADMGKVRLRLVHWIETDCCGSINKACSKRQIQA